MFRTRITDLLGIDYPIIQGGMVHLSLAPLVAAVANAGGLGVITSANLETPDRLREELKRTMALTDKPFGVNINLAPAANPVDNEAFIDVSLDEGVRIFETSGRSPAPLMERFRAGNAIVIHKAPGGVRFAQTAEEVGCDAVAIIGAECGGHPGPDDTGSLVLVPATVAALKIPVIAGGGFADAAGLVTALALGADGVLMGTRFMATQECPAHPKFKQWLVESTETDTLVTQRSIRAPSRNLKNAAALKVQEMEGRGATLEELLTVTSGQNSNKVYFEGDLEAGLAECGQVVGIINDVPTVKEVIDGIVSGAREIIEKKLPGYLAA